MVVKRILSAAFVAFALLVFMMAFSVEESKVAFPAFLAIYAFVSVAESLWKSS